jgi:hypothetical protein
MHRRKRQRKKQRQRQNNPWAICRAAQKKYGLSDAEYERCVLKVKKKGARAVKSFI